MQLAVRYRDRLVIGFVGFPDNGGLIAALGQMAIQAVGRHIEHAVFVPAHMQVTGVEGHITDLGERLDPVEALADTPPECIRIGNRLGIHLGIFGFVNPGICGECGRHGIEF